MYFLANAQVPHSFHSTGTHTRPKKKQKPFPSQSANLPLGPLGVGVWLAPASQIGSFPFQGSGLMLPGWFSVLYQTKNRHFSWKTRALRQQHDLSVVFSESTATEKYHNMHCVPARTPICQFFLGGLGLETPLRGVSGPSGSEITKKKGFLLRVWTKSPKNTRRSLKMPPKIHPKGLRIHFFFPLFLLIYSIVPHKIPFRFWRGICNVAQSILIV